MEMPIGKNTVLITSNTVTEIAGKDVVKLTCESTDHAADPIDVIIWLTDKSMGIARAQLKLCGFDIDAEEFETLVAEPSKLKGTEIPILVEDWNGQLRASIMLNPTPSKKRLQELQTGLRAVKKGGETPPADDSDLPF